MLEQVQQYRRLGWNIIPVRPDGSKKAAVRWTRYRSRPASDRTVAKWFGHCGYHPAVILGPASGGLACRDFDVADSYHAWGLDHPELVRTLPTAETGKGFHVYARTGWAGFQRYDDGELRANAKHYCLLTPAIHETGKAYSWIIPPSTDNLGDFTRDGLVQAGLMAPAVAPDGAQQPPEPPVRHAHSYVNGGVTWPDVSAQEAEQVFGAIELTVPVAVGRRHRDVFQFARKLRGIERFANRDPRELYAFVRTWHKRALPYIGTKAFEDTWIDFLEGWPLIRQPADEGFMRMVQQIADGQPITRYEDPATNALAAICRELQRLRGDEPFYLATRLAGKLLGRTPPWASGRLRLFCWDGLLRLVRKGTLAGRRASTFRWIGPMAGPCVLTARPVET